jgi:hypothetical protein
VKIVGCLLLLSGFFLVLAALVLLPAITMRVGFSVAALCVEALGITLLTRSYMARDKERS